MEIKGRLFSKTGMTAFFTGLILVFVFAPLVVRSVPAPFWFQEYFFNTLQIAENFKRLGFPTFDGVTPTNDFSPVWTAVLAGLSSLVPSDSGVFFYFGPRRSGAGAGRGADFIQPAGRRAALSAETARTFCHFVVFSRGFSFHGINGIGRRTGNTVPVFKCSVFVKSFTSALF